MINLIPNQQKTEMTTNFQIRFMAVLFFAISVTLLLGAMALLPAYFAVSVEKNLVNHKLENQASEVPPILDPVVNERIKAADLRLTILKRKNAGGFMLSEQLVDAILSERLGDIKVTGITYQTEMVDEKVHRDAILHGIAPSRERLLLFKNLLAQSGAFNMVDLPISNFIKGSDIEFSLSLNLP